MSGRTVRTVASAAAHVGKQIERLLRRGIRNARPSTLMHELHWRLRDRSSLAEWTRQRLQLGPHFWLFVLGLNNSGTTLLVDLLKSHPLMRWLPNEGQYLTSGLPLPRQYEVPRLFSQRMDVFHWTEDADPAPALRVQYDWAVHYQSQPGILLEKSPPNALRSRWLQQNFSPSRFIAIFRHPYAVCEGMRRRDGHTIEQAALHWAQTYQQLLEDVKHLRYCLSITYEDLCAQPELHLTLLEEFLDMETPFDRSIIEAPRRIHNIDSAQEPIRNFNQRSLQQLSIGDIAVIDRIAGPVMEQLGYQSLRVSDLGRTVFEVHRSEPRKVRARRPRHAFPLCPKTASRWLALGRGATAVIS
jgi:hypothetical protein